MGTIFCTQSQGYENTPYLSSPDIWVREPDCLHLPYKATLPRHRVKAALPNTKEQTQGGCQNEDAKKHGPNERTDKNSRKRTKQNGDKQSIEIRIYAEFKTLVLRMLKELSEDLSSIKKTQSETKDTLGEMKNSL